MGFSVIPELLLKDTASLMETLSEASLSLATFDGSNSLAWTPLSRGNKHLFASTAWYAQPSEN